ncbi:MAG: hypothetical protein IT564_11625 [Rhodospirillales bacterium]|nr:hypothetical protein [Rhodospirillales bacterium]
MNKRSKAIKLEVDGKLYISQVAPETIDEFDGACPACGSGEYYELCTFIQQGFVLDACTTLCHCERCFETFHYNYTVEAMYIEKLNFADNEGKA